LCKKNNIADYTTAGQQWPSKLAQGGELVLKDPENVGESPLQWEEGSRRGGGECAASYKPVSLLIHFNSLCYFLIGTPCIQKFCIVLQNINL